MSCIRSKFYSFTQLQKVKYRKYIPSAKKLNFVNLKYILSTRTIHRDHHKRKENRCFFRIHCVIILVA